MTTTATFRPQYDAFTVANIKTDRNNRPYVTLFSKDGDCLFKAQGIAAQLILSTVDEAGETVKPGDLVAIGHTGTYDASWKTETGETVPQNGFRAVKECRIVARKGSGIQVRAQNGQMMTARR